MQSPRHVDQPNSGPAKRAAKTAAQPQVARQTTGSAKGVANSAKQRTRQQARPNGETAKSKSQLYMSQGLATPSRRPPPISHEKRPVPKPQFHPNEHRQTPTQPRGLRPFSNLPLSSPQWVAFGQSVDNSRRLYPDGCDGLGTTPTVE